MFENEGRGVNRNVGEAKLTTKRKGKRQYGTRFQERVCNVIIQYSFVFDLFELRMLKVDSDRETVRMRAS